MDKWVMAGIGGFIGSALRFMLSGMVQGVFANFPAGTLFVNFTGTLFLGLVMFSSEYLGLFDDQTRTLLTIGIAGGYTTMSAFSYESFKLVENGEPLLFALNVGLTISLMLFAVFLAKLIVMKVGGV